MTGKATLTKTRSGRPRVNVSPQALAAEVEQLKSDLSGIKRVLAPAFAPAPPPPMRSPMSRGPGDYRPEPFAMRQAGSNANPWAGDIEHSESYMEAIRTGQNIGELRQRSADDAMRRAIAHQPSALIWESPAFCGQCRPATPCANCRGRSTVVRDNAAHIEPPRQSSVVHREWEQFPDHQPPPGAEPGWSVARQQAAAMPPRQPETGEVVKGL